MKRIALLSMGLIASLTSASQAQLSMQMGNGWNFTFAGNVNAFVTHEFFTKDGATFTPGGIVQPGPDLFDETRIRTGLLPAFAVFDAKGKEGNTDLGVHFGFAPEIQCATGVHDCFGAQIDMRQVYMTVGGTWGQILAGRELGLFGRQNILTDQTLFGVGATGSLGDTGPGTGGGTTLGRIGFGYIYPNFNAQVTFSTPTGRSAQLSVGLFEAASNGDYHEIQLPRVESELVFTHGSHKVWLGGLVQSTKNAITATDKVSATAWGGSGGFRWQGAQFSVTGSGYYGQGLGTTFLTANAECAIATCGANGSDDLRKSYGFIGQVTMMPAANSKTTFAVSYGSSYLKESSTEKAAATTFRTENTLVSGGIYHQATKSLKVVAEVNYNWTKDKIDATATNKSFTPAVGLMLFF